MAVGTLNVAVTATTRKAQEELKAFRAQVRGVGADVKRASNDFGGNSIRDFEKKFAKPLSPVGPDDAAKINTFRSSIVDLRRDTGRYNETAKAQVGTLKSLKQSLGALKTGIVGASAAPLAFGIGFEFGQSIRAYVQEIHSAKDAWRQLGAVLGQTSSIQDEFIGKMERLQTIIDAEGRAKTAAAEKERQVYKDFEKDIRNAQFDIDEAMGFDVSAQRRAFDDFEKYGDAARRLAEMRREASRQELATAERKEQAEKRADALAARKRKAEEAHRKKIQEEAKVVADLEKEARQFWMSDAAKRRDDALASVADPSKRDRASRALEKLEIAEGVKRDRERRMEDADTIRGRGRVEALDARTAEGWAALRASIKDGPQQKIVKNTERTVFELTRIANNIENLDGGEAFDPFES
jgi:hypothetical protein